MEVTVKTLIPELAQSLKANAGDEGALHAVFKAVHDAGNVPQAVALLELWSEAAHGERLPDAVLAELYYLTAMRAPEALSRELCRTALDLCPSHADALSLLEELTDETWADELCARYQNFLEDAPSHEASPRFRVAMIERQVWAQC